ncbi:acyl-CoA dehydrogenase family protein [Nocardia sp. CDC159]|uniref:Acyl-CoA dehydrogenase family protein n=1 Tax=Nocardia pulmonis TaxID=2951408 RepID=A0A9X2IWR9_9NOCA|nr:MULTISPECIES: acyl-CoA dehydrogenase family protein [Nocardia]MCM6772151.1 acyl-CoA dehydrogenase family protein [Nocardia pulmonis]MCM6785191.1 acyl-CoA dehydrogenase family protein [Nocardia sp. CDC159]
MVRSTFSLPAAEQQLLDRISILAKDFQSRAAYYDERSEIPIDALRALHDAGLDAAVLPAHVGGIGLSYAAFGSIVRILARADPSVATIWTMHAGAGVGLAELTVDSAGSFPTEVMATMVGREVLGLDTD